MHALIIFRESTLNFTLFVKCMRLTNGCYRPGKVIRGYHVYKAIWTPDLGEILVNECQQEIGNSEDLYAVCVIKDDIHHYIQ